MNLLEQTLSSIKIPDAALPHTVDTVLTTHTSMNFGRLKEVLLRYIRITGERHPAPPQTSVIISCADHGVAAESVSAYPPETTLNMMCNYLIARGGAANAVANYANAQLIVADLGVNADTSDIPGLLHKSIARGTANMTAGPAMTRAQAIRSVETGIALANERADHGDRCILPGEMGISNTTSSAAIVAALLELTPEEVTGRGANISDRRLAHKIEIVRRALTVNAPDPHDGLDVLAKVGGFELGCIAGLILGAAARRMLIVLDGANTTSAALIAHALAPNCVHYLLASHASLTEHSQPHALRRLGLSPILRLDIRLSEAAGSSIALRMLTQMIKIWDILDEAKEGSPLSPPFNFPCPSLCPQEEKTTVTFAPPSASAMEACQYRLDNLAKPIHSLGYLERIAVQLAGTTGRECPPSDLGAALLILADGKLFSADLSKILSAITADTHISVYLLSTPKNMSASNAARRAADTLARSHPLLILGAAGAGDDALAGAINGAAEAGSLILPGDTQSDRVAREYAGTNSSLRPYILHIVPDMLTADTEMPAGIAGILGTEIVRAALHVVNDMKTFAETGVAVAIDGAGAGRQVRGHA